MQQNKTKTKIDGALGAMIIEDQPTHSIYYSMLSHNVNHVKVVE